MRFFSGVLTLLLVMACTGSPWGQGASEDDAATRCVYLADRASETFGANVGRLYVPDGDRDAWTELVTTVEGQIREARAQCGCGEPACEKATEAVTELGDLVTKFDDSLRRGGMPLSPGRQLERIHGLLNEARRLARTGG